MRAGFLRPGALAGEVAYGAGALLPEASSAQDLRHAQAASGLKKNKAALGG